MEGGCGMHTFNWLLMFTGVTSSGSHMQSFKNQYASKVFEPDVCFNFVMTGLLIFI